MGHVAASTRERILEEGLALMSQSGLSGVTLGVLADQVGMSKSGLFAHFRSKEDVQIGLLQYMEGFATARVVAPTMKVEEGLPRLKALILNWFGWTRRAGLPGGCPVAAGMFEFDDIHGPVRNKILEMEAEWRDLLSGLVQQAMDRGHLGPDLDRDQFVWELCAIYLGHHAAYRFLRSADAERRAQRAYEALLDRAAHVSVKKKTKRTATKRVKKERL
jgi:AcrR family transcriptional regulator